MLTKVIIAVSVLLGMFLINVEEISAADWYVSTSGSPSGLGTISNPWNIETGIKGGPAGNVKPGDTLYLRGGKYGHGGSYYSNDPNLKPTVYAITISGSSGTYVTVRPYQNEHVIIDGGIDMQGSYLTVRDLEITNTDINRWTDCIGSFPCWNDPLIYTRPQSVGMRAQNQKLINNIIHDGDGAVGYTSDSYNSEIHGNILYNYGHVAPDRAHGHGIYFQNNQGTKLIKNNILLPALDDYGIHGYGEASTARVDNTTLTGNIHYVRNWRVATGATSTNVVVNNNYLWESSMNNSNITGLTMRNNYLGGIASSYLTTNQLQIDRDNSSVISANTVCGAYPYNVYFGSAMNLNWNTTTYCNFGSRMDAPLFLIFSTSGNSTYTFDSWKTKTGYDALSTFSKSKPTVNHIFYLQNDYEPLRGNIAVYNWTRAAGVSVDLSVLGYKSGDRYEIHNAYDYYGDTPITGVYNGSPVNVDMSASRWSRQVIIGYTSVANKSWSKADDTFPDFGAFVVRGNTGSITATPTPTQTLRPSSTPTSMPTNTPTSIPLKPGDANADSKVDLLDYVIWLNHYGVTTANKYKDGDFNADTKVDLLDYVIWLNNFGK